jgi:hypothetical protein
MSMKFTASVIAASLMMAPMAGISAFAQTSAAPAPTTAAPAAMQDQSAEPAGTPQKAMKKAQTPSKKLQKHAKLMKAKPKVKAPAGADQQPSAQD